MHDLVFKNVKDVEAGALELVKVQPEFRDAISLCGFPKIRVSDGGFKALYKTILGQQLSTTVANSIWRKLEDNNLTEIDSVLLAENNQLRALGLSNAKAAYVKGLAGANINYGSLIEKSNLEIIQELTAVRGIGLWTAQIYLMFSLRRFDVFASGDLALKEGVKVLFQMDNRPSLSEMDCLSQRWKPFRTIAAMIIWKYYDYIKKKE